MRRAEARVDAGAVVCDLQRNGSKFQFANCHIVNCRRASRRRGRGSEPRFAGGHRYERRRVAQADSVIEQVDQRTLHRLTIDWNQRNCRVEGNREIDIGIGFAKIGDGLARERVDITGHRIQMRHPRER